MATFLAAIFAGIGAVCAVTFVGVAVVQARHRRVAAAGWLLAAALLVGGAVVARPFAEARNHWHDRDGDGMLDGFANGSYDWFDVNGGDWLRAWGLLDFLVLAGTTLVVVVRDASRSTEPTTF